MYERELSEAKKDFRTFHRLLMSVDKVYRALEAVRVEETSANESRQRFEKERAKARADLDAVIEEQKAADKAVEKARTEKHALDAYARKVSDDLAEFQETVKADAQKEARHIVQAAHSAAEQDRAAAQASLAAVNDEIAEASKTLASIAQELEEARSELESVQNAKAELAKILST